MAELALIQLDQYNPDDLKRAIKAAFLKLNLADCFHEGEKILIKPNMLAAAAPEKAVTPHPLVFAALAECLKETGVELSYGDSPALDAPEKAARVCGFEAVAARQGVAWADFSQAVETDIPGAKVFRRIHLAKGVAAADGLVSLAKLKTHALTGMTGVIKNQFGVIPGTVKAQLHVNFPDLGDFSQMLTDINLLVRPRLAVMDAIVAMEGNGPKSGQAREVGLLLLSTDIVAVDAAAAALIGFDPNKMPFIMSAARAGLGESDLSQIKTYLMRVSGQSIATSEGLLSQIIGSLRIPDFKLPEIERSTMSRATRFGAPLIKRFILNRPVIDPQLCTRCGVCERVCPVEPKAVVQHVKTSVPVYNYRRCIRCYCCQETCPAGAISIHKSWLGNWFKT